MFNNIKLLHSIKTMFKTKMSMMIIFLNLNYIFHIQQKKNYHNLFNFLLIEAYIYRHPIVSLDNLIHHKFI